MRHTHLLESLNMQSRGSKVQCLEHLAEVLPDAGMLLSKKTVETIALVCFSLESRVGVQAHLCTNPFLCNGCAIETSTYSQDYGLLLLT